jgi:hypothetical protein
MKKRLFCIASLLLVVLALRLDFGAKDYSRKNTSLRAWSVTAAAEEKPLLRAEAERMSSRGNVFAMIGLAAAVSSMACLIVSFRRHEAAWWRSIPVALLIWYLIMQFKYPVLP